MSIRPLAPTVVSLALALLLAGCGGNAAVVEAPASTTSPRTAYAIKFDVPQHVGERSHLVTDHAEDLHTKVTRDGAVVEDKHDRTVYHLDAVLSVAEVDPKGRSTRERYDVKDFTINGQRVAASTIEVRRRGRKEDAVIQVDSAPPRDEVRKALGTVLTLSLAEVSTDQVFGTATPQQVGASWRLDPDFARASMKEQGLVAGKISGAASLRGLTRGEDAADYLDINADMELSDIELPEAPKGAIVEEGKATAQVQTAMPVDGRADHGATHMALKIAFRVRVPAKDGASMFLDVTGDTKRDVRWTSP